MSDPSCHLAEILPSSSERVGHIAQAIQRSPADTYPFLSSKVTVFSAYKHSSCLSDINPFKIGFFLAKIGIGMLKKKRRSCSRNQPVMLPSSGRAQIHQAVASVQKERKIP